MASCDLLSFHYLCAIRDSRINKQVDAKIVVICFHFIIFVLSGTAQRHVQNAGRSCDLLSFHYLCAIRDSEQAKQAKGYMVVICFHFIIFVLSGTAECVPAPSPAGL